MAIAKKPQKVKLFIGYITDSPELAIQAKNKLIAKYGKADLEIAPIAFDHTNYYTKIGQNLQKYFLSFEKLIKHEKIVKIKHYTNNLEIKLSKSKNRKINIDPGFLTLSNIFLASCKEYYHRTYLTMGIYLENELYFSAKKYNFWDWTYPDYKKEEYLDFFRKMRKKYHQQIRK